MRNVALILTLLLLIFLPFRSPADNSSADNSADAPLVLQGSPLNNQTGHPTPSSNNIEELHDIYGPVNITENPPYLLIAAILLLVVLIAAALYWLKKKRKVPAPPATPPWQQALLDLTDARKLLNPEKGLLYMERVSQILRSYIESRFAIQSTRQTTREFLKGLTRVEGNSPLLTYKTELQECLERADMAKFAHHLPNFDNLEQMEAAVTSFVKKTEPAKQQPAKNKRRGRS